MLWSCQQVDHVHVLFCFVLFKRGIKIKRDSCKYVASKRKLRNQDQSNIDLR